MLSAGLPPDVTARRHMQPFASNAENGMKVQTGKSQCSKSTYEDFSGGYTALIMMEGQSSLGLSKEETERNHRADSMAGK